AVDAAATQMLSPAGQAARTATQGAFAQYAAKPLLRGSTGLLARGSGLLGAMEAYRAGRPRTAAAIAGASLLGGASPGQLMTAAGPIARGVIGAAGQAASGLKSPGALLAQQDVATPESPAEPGTAPESTPTPAQPIKALPGRWG